MYARRGSNPWKALMFMIEIMYRSKWNTHSCESCGHECAQKVNLEGHMKMHIGQRSFGCDIFPTSFSLKTNLDIHVGTHTHIHTRKGVLKKHVRFVHRNEL